VCAGVHGAEGLLMLFDMHHGVLLFEATALGKIRRLKLVSEGKSLIAFWFSLIPPPMKNLSASFLSLFLSASLANGAPVISEFMASNDKSLYDEDGESSDWLELYNPDGTAVNLDGYFLSADPGNLEMWKLPAVTLPPGGFLIVFASNKNRDVGELHTNFRLSKDAGGYLALVEPDGRTLLSEFANYPEQFDDFSYGFSQSGGNKETILVREEVACKLLVPTGDIGASWRNEVFDDSAWPDATTGVGFDQDSELDNLIGPGGDVETESFGINSSVYVRIPFHIDSLANLVRLTFRMKYDDGFIAYLNGTEIASGNKPPSPSWNSNASAERANGQALVFADTNLTAQANALLQAGNNVLTIHGMNVSQANGDLLVLPRLEAEFTTSVGEPGALGYFQIATPGLNNDGSLGLPSGSVTISQPGRGFTGSLTVTLSADSPTAQIRYTTNGTVPGASSALYSGGNINIGGSTILRARAFEPGLTPGPVAEEGYIRLSANAVSFSSDIPVIIMERFNGGSNAANGKTFTFFAFFEPDPTSRRTILNKPYSLGTRGGWKVRGSSSSGFAKKAYSIEAWNELDLNKDIAPLGLPSESDWILNARSQFDRTLMHNTFIYELSNQIGRYAMRTKFVELFKDDNGGDLNYTSDYAGVYTFMEKITRDKDRVDVERLPDSITTEPGIAGGYMMKIDRLDPGDSGLSAGGQTMGWVYPKEDDVTTPQVNWMRNYINAMNNSLSTADYADYIEVGDWVDHHLLNVLTQNADALRLSTYFHKKRNGKLAFGPIWDFDRALESTDGRDDNPSTWAGGTNYFTYPWWGTLFNNENFWQSYIDRYFELRDSEFATTNIHRIVDGMAAELAEAQVRNLARWPAFPSRYGNYQGEITHMKDWLSTRLNWMDGQFSPRPTTNRANGIYPAGTTVNLSAALNANRKIFYTLDGTDPRPIADGGTPAGTTLVSDSHPVRAFVPTSDIGTNWRTNANFDDSTWLSGSNGVGYERGSGYATYININVNTQMASQTSCYIRMKFNVNAVDLATWNFMILQMRYDDGFVAFLNGTEIASALDPDPLLWSSSATTDHNDGEAVTFLPFEADAFIGLLQPGENLLAIHALNVGTSSSDFLNQAKLFAGFDENGGGEITATEYTGPITLTDTARIFARVFDSTGGHSTGSGQTPVGTGWSAPLRAEYLINEIPADASNLAVTEIMSDPYDLGDLLTADSEYEFIELQNISNDRISLTDVQFYDGVAFNFSSGNVPSLAPGERVIIVKNIAAFRQIYGAGRDSLIAGTFTGSLSSAGEQVEIRAANNAVIQSFVYPETPKRGHSLILSGATWTASRSVLGSPGTEESLVPDIFISEVLSNSVLPDVDAVELQNPGGSPVDLSGWFLTDDLSQPEKFRIPDGTAINGNSFLTFTESDFNATPGTGTSFALSSFGEEIFLVAALPDGTRTDYVEGFDFGDASAGASFGRHTISTGAVDYPSLTMTSLGSANGPPVAGPLVITELMYHPLDGNAEFVEIRNISGSAIPLMGVEVSGTGYVFGALAPALQSGEYVLITDVDPADFRATWNPPLNVNVYGPYIGKLDNGGEKLRIRMPESTGIPAEPELMVSVDITDYADAGAWPVEPDGGGYSLQRILPAAYGSEPLNWTIGAIVGGSPGTDGDWREAFFTPAELSNPAISGLLADADSDGVGNLVEYLLGTNPRDGSSVHLPDLELFESEGETYARFIYQIRNSVGGFSLASEMSDALDGWTPANLQIVSTTDNGDGTSAVIAETTDPIDGETYFRLRVVEN
jgi:hypothetical protein